MVVFGATGFGSSIISVPVLAHWFPLTFAVPVVATGNDEEGEIAFEWEAGIYPDWAWPGFGCRLFSGLLPQDHGY